MSDGCVCIERTSARARQGRAEADSRRSWARASLALEEEGAAWGAGAGSTLGKGSREPPSAAAGGAAVVPGRTTVWPQHGPCVSGPHRSECGAPTWKARPQEGGGKGGDVEGRSGYSSLLLIRL